MSDHYDVPPLVDAPWVTGDATGRTHAVAWHVAADALGEQGGQPHPNALMACGVVADLVTGWGAFEDSNHHVARHPCQECAWIVAIAQGTVQEHLRAIAPSRDDLPALARLVQEPLMAVRVCEAIIASTGGRKADLEDRHIAHLLGHATAHAPMLLVPEDCGEDQCDHRPEERGDDPAWRCPSPEASAACGTCSVRAGRYAGEWEGMFAVECTVLAPCSVLTTFARHHGITIGTNVEEAR